jgi:hypothetical protein
MTAGMLPISPSSWNEYFARLATYVDRIGARWSASYGARPNYQSWRRRLPCRYDWPLPWSHLPLSRVQSTCSVQVLHCGQTDHLNDDLHIVTLSQELISSPPVDLWPNDIRRVPVPADVADLLLTKPRTRSVADRARSLLCDPRKCPALGKDRTRREMPTKSRFDPKATSATHRNRKLGGQPWTALAKVAF